ncbi:hypothetical protein NE235_30880 [Actinoallomurus spadix]|uniref:Uncharacterized protein n=1 Tax=Actinoallomurus spadix TaxID=79912 RepID=A0ABP3GBY8_9ACTN|nr:hypothetical protein [Actinoallomurus spadix]MCO5990522.1 hypothetical protein [Actinoallomurus spadix]
MKTSTKVTGLTLAGLTTAGVAIAAIGTGPSTTVARDAGRNRAYTASDQTDHTERTAARPSTSARPSASARSSASARRRTGPVTVPLTTRYTVRNVRAGHSVAVLRRAGHRWRVVGVLRATDRRVRGATVSVRRPTTVVAVAGHHAVRLVVPPHAAVVVADNGRIGVVGWRFLQKVVPTTPTPTPSAPTTPPVTPPTTAPAPAPTGSQAPVVGGLKGRVSTKW